jgi:hypothetical protein
MSFKAKVAILLASVLLSLIGFNLIASSQVVDILKVGKMAGNRIIANVLAKTETPAPRPALVKG